MEKIFEEVQRNLGERVRGNLVALALTGSRAGGYNHARSDYDFFAVFEQDIPFYYIDFERDGETISVKVEGRERFEERLRSPLHSFAEQGSFVWLPYFPLIGESYLKSVEREGRSLLLDDFIKTLPNDQPVLIAPERIAEFQLIKEGLIWPSSVNRLRAIASAEKNPLDRVVPKYVEMLESRGKERTENGEFLVTHSGNGRRNGSSFLKLARLDAQRYLEKKRVVDPANYVRGIMFLSFQIPEKIANAFYTFPRFEEDGKFLRYAGPPLGDFVNSRRYLNPFRDSIRKLKENLLSN